MAPSSIKYFYSAYSAYAYIGHQDFMKIVHGSGSNVIHKPFDLMKCLNDIGYHQMEKRTAKTLEYQFGRQRDRWSEYRGVQIPKITPSTHNNGSEITDLNFNIRSSIRFKYRLLMLCVHAKPLDQ